MARLVHLLGGEEVLLLLARRGVDVGREPVGHGVLAPEEQRVVPERRLALEVGELLRHWRASSVKSISRGAPVALLPARVEVLVADCVGRRAHRYICSHERNKCTERSGAARAHPARHARADRRARARRGDPPRRGRARRRCRSPPPPTGSSRRTQLLQEALLLAAREEVERLERLVLDLAPRELDVAEWARAVAAALAADLEEDPVRHVAFTELVLEGTRRPWLREEVGALAGRAPAPGRAGPARHRLARSRQPTPPGGGRYHRASCSASSPTRGRTSRSACSGPRSSGCSPA